VGKLGQVFPSCVRTFCRCLQDGVAKEVALMIIEDSISELERAGEEFAFCARDAVLLKKLLAYEQEAAKRLQKLTQTPSLHGLPCRYRDTRLYPGKRSCWGCRVVNEMRKWLESKGASSLGATAEQEVAAREHG